MTEHTSHPALWDRVWENTADDEYLWWYTRERGGARGTKIFRYVEERLGRVDRLNTVEVGSGTGVYSRLFAERGARVTLLDYSPPALELAERYFRSAGLLDRAELVVGDAFALPSELTGRFDVAMSFGTIEHFVYPERLEIARAHVKLVRPGGVVAISVPNRSFLPHEILKGALQRAGKWGLGYEGAFTRAELRNVAGQLGLKNVKIVGSSFGTDIQRYLKIVANTRPLRSVLPSWRPNPDVANERAGMLDDFFGADIVLLGTT